MGRSCFLTVLLISVLLFLSLSQGFGRRIKIMRHYQRGRSSEENTGIGREMAEMVMDYRDPGPNTNPRGGALFNSPPGPPRR